LAPIEDEEHNLRQANGYDANGDNLEYDLDCFHGTKDKRAHNLRQGQTLHRPISVAIEFDE